MISPDGKYIAYGDFSGIQVQSIGTGEAHLLPRPESIQRRSMVSGRLVR